MKQLLVSLLLCALPCFALAETECNRLLFGGWSHHTDGAYDYNESHNMVGLQCNSISVMRFNNSYGDESYGIGYDWVGTTVGPVDLGAYAGLWSGYEGYDYGRPVGGLRARVNLGDLGVVLTSAFNITTLHLEYKF